MRTTSVNAVVGRAYGHVGRLASRLTVMSAPAMFSMARSSGVATPTGAVPRPRSPMAAPATSSGPCPASSDSTT